MSQYIYPAGIKATPIPSPLSGIFDTLKDIGGKVVDFYGAGQQAQGANAVLQQQNQALQAQQSGGGISTTTLLILGAVGIGAVLLLKKKKA